MEGKKTIVLVLRSGGDFHFRDIELISRHIFGKWKGKTKPHIICLWDKVKDNCILNGIEFIKLKNNWPGSWARMELFSPEMEKYRPFLYIDLDTAIINSLENIFDLIPDTSMFITLEDFWQKGELAGGLMWIPAKSEKIKVIWDKWDGNVTGKRMDHFLRKVIKPDIFWQQITHTIYDFKPAYNILLIDLPKDADLVCFHGKPRIFSAAESSISIGWVKKYVCQKDFPKNEIQYDVTVIIPYNIDRGYLKQAIDSVPKDVQLILSQGDGNWPSNFNKVLGKVKGRFVKYLHEDDMLTENCIKDSVQALEEQKVDFIHGNAIELNVITNKTKLYRPIIKFPTTSDLMKRNMIHSATLMYRKELFDEMGGFNESLWVMEEFEYNLRLLSAGKKIGYCDSTLAIYRRHPLQKVRVVPKEIKIKEKELVKSWY